ncbi:hypothetical protein [Mesorhizobium denitrificans]|uniref:Uncharacterized protein n=1 Tax=Mesorhizobium denitrificans TaxID=2294114 RepID=A0A371XF45_9HYPH|nr:hypothetical protein [Mesorhizobium denitrificans]RFC67847.1 hypothetical protein DY251_09700 [Mesorhizobium denitrificans]
MLNNRPSDEFIDEEKRVRVGLFASDAAPTLSPSDPAYWADFEQKRQADEAARMAEYRAIGEVTTNPQLALQRVEQQQRDARATFDSMSRDHTALDAEYANYSRSLGGQPAPVRDSAALDNEYLAYCRSFGS